MSCAEAGLGVAVTIVAGRSPTVVLVCIGEVAQLASLCGTFPLHRPNPLILHRLTSVECGFIVGAIEVDAHWGSPDFLAPLSQGFP